MPISRIKTDGINDSAVTLVKTDSLFVNTEISGTEAAKMPVGTTAQREGSPKAGDQRFNSTISLMEYYDGTQWKAIDSPPLVSSISPTTETDANANITIIGSNFSSGATVKFIGNDGTEYNSPTVTVNSVTEIVAQTPASALTVANEPYDIQVTNTSGLSGTLADALDAGSTPTWSTSAGNIGTIYEDEAISSLSIAATDADGQSVSITSSDFSITGVTLNSDGTITGTPNVNDTPVSAGVTHTFDGEATDGVNTATRTFNILRKWVPGSVSQVPATSIASLYDENTADGMIWFQNANINSGTAFQMRYASYDGRGWLETLYSQDSATSTPWDHWLNKGGTNYTRPQMYSYNLSSGGLNYSSGDSSFVRLHSSLSLVDVVITSKSSRTGNGIAATGQNQASALPLVASNDLVGSGATSCRAALAAYFGGYGEGFHAKTGGGVDYTAGWSKAGLGNFEIILSYRNGSQALGEWHIADGSILDGSTYASNIGYRNEPDFSAEVGSWSDTSTQKAAQYAISSSNVLSVWVTDEL